MHASIEEEYRAGLRELLRTHGTVVQIKEAQQARHPELPEQWVSVYGWEDFDATAHLHTPTASELALYSDAASFYGSCELLIPAGVTLEEVAYCEWAGTGVESDDEVGINAVGGGEDSATEIRCRCGKYRNLTVRWKGSVSDALQAVLAQPRILFTL